MMSSRKSEDASNRECTAEDDTRCIILGRCGEVLLADLCPFGAENLCGIISRDRIPCRARGAVSRSGWTQKPCRSDISGCVLSSARPRIAGTSSARTA
jgi:hypothetical protein